MKELTLIAHQGPPAGDSLPALVSAPVSPLAQAPQQTDVSRSLHQAVSPDHSKPWPPRKMPEAGVHCQGFSNAIPVNSDSPGLPAGENKGWLSPGPCSFWVGRVLNGKSAARASWLGLREQGCFIKSLFKAFSLHRALAAAPTL